MNRNKYRVLLILLAALLIFTLTACSGGGESDAAASDQPAPSLTPEASATEASETPEASVTPTPTEEPVSRAPMNDPKTIVEGMESLMDTAYENYGPEADRLKIPADFTPGPNEVFSVDVFDWDLGDLTAWMDETGAVNQVMANIRDHTIVNNVAMALFASSVEGNTPEDGQKIADALHIGDMFFPENYDKYIYVLDQDGYYYIYEIANNLWLTVIHNDIELAYAECIFFDIDGNEAENPASGTDGYDEEGNYSSTTGDEALDALVQVLLPPESTIVQAKSESVQVNSLTDYQAALKWYEDTLPKLGFESVLSEEEQALLDMDPESRLYSGTINGQPVTISIRDWTGTESGDMSLIDIMFFAQ